MKNKFKFFVCGLIFAILCFGVKTKQFEGDKSYKLVFNDEFNGRELDRSKWNYESGQRNSAINCSEAIKLSDGYLIIHPFTKNGKYYSSIITTEGKFEFNKGYVEIRAKFNDIVGIWSDAWLYCKTAGLNEQNVNKNGFELDIFEHRKYDFNSKDISGYVNHVLHWNGYDQYHKCVAVDTGDLNLDKGFHIFGLVWDENGYTFLVDGKKTGKFDKLQTNAKMFLLFSVEIGYLENWVQSPPKILDTDILTIDYIRVYQK